MKKGEDMSLPPSIATRSSRAVASNASTGYSRGLDGVQGKVGLGSLYGSAGGGFSENSLAASGGLSMSGAGRLSEALILAALSKRLHKFQYCYEKALLGDPQLAGNIMMEWVIHPGGQATSVRVVRSQLNRSALHSCIGSEISTIRFPSPQGGSVTVKYPFNFSSTSL